MKTPTKYVLTNNITGAYYDSNTKTFSGKAHLGNTPKFDRSDAALLVIKNLFDNVEVMRVKFDNVGNPVSVFPSDSVVLNG